MRYLIRIAALAGLCLPGIALAATPQNLGDLANMIAQLFDSATFDLIVLALVLYFWGIASSLFKGSKGQEMLRTQLLWGLFVIFLAVSVWGVVQLLQTTVFGSNIGATSSSGSVQTCSGLNCTFGNQ